MFCELTCKDVLIIYDKGRGMTKMLSNRNSWEDFGRAPKIYLFLLFDAR